ncbi:copia protein [Tanacetum coccineum]
MSTTQTEMSSAEIDHIIAQRVTDAIEAIAIYETKIRMAHDPVNQSKRNEVVRAHATRPGSKKAYVGKLPYCNRCKLHHAEPCTLKCGNCKRVGHMTRICKALVASTSQRSHVANKKVVITCYECGGSCTVKCGNCKRVGHMTRNCKAPVASTSQRALVANKKAVITCYECGRQGHFRNECPKLSNQIQDTLDCIWNGQNCKKIEVKFSVPGRGLAVLDSGLHDSLDSCKLLRDNMANENVPAPAPTRFDDQILPFAAWVPIGKSNFVLDLQKKQKNPIFQISVDILQNTNFFRAFTASASVPAIYIQQFWNTLTYEAKTGAYSFQLDENRFILDANLLREALEITPIDQAHQFVSPPSGDAIMDFVNELGYTEEIHFVSRMAVNNLYQPWRAILSMINQCLTGKTSGFDRPRYPVLQMLWGIITSTNVDYAELMWEEFVQAMQTFLVDKANLSIAPQKGKKTKPHVIPYCRFTKLIICHLGRTHNIHQRSASPFHLAEEDHRLGNLKFVPKGEDDEVFGMQIPNELITNNIRNAPYYNAYLEMVAKHDQKITAEKGGKKKPATAKQLKPKPVKEKSSKPSPAPKPKSPLKLIDEDEPTQPEPEPEPEHQGTWSSTCGGVAIREPVAEVTRPLPVVEGKGKVIATEEQAAYSLLALHTPKRRNDASANIVRDSPSHVDAETGVDTDKQTVDVILRFYRWVCTKVMIVD